MSEPVIIRRHAIDAGDGSEDARMVVCPPIAHNADRPYWKKNCKSLPDLVVQAVASDLLQQDFIGISKYLELSFGDFAEAANGESGSGEGVPGEEFPRHTKFPAESANFVFEQRSKRFDKLEFKVVGEAADIVMGFDFCRRSSGGTHGFDYIRVQRSLNKKFGHARIMRRFHEFFDESCSNDSPLLFRVGNSLEATKKSG